MGGPSGPTPLVPIAAAGPNGVGPESPPTTAGVSTPPTRTTALV
ncbi:DUF6053 domain-containing protein [Lysobacter enzymogenes]